MNDEKDFRRFIKVGIGKESLRIVHEDSYVYWLGENNFQAADTDSRVLQIRERHENLIESLRQQIINVNETTYSGIKELYSYHVNIGHGNHSLIVFKTENDVHIWMVDCSERSQRHRDNIDNCLTYIKKRFHLESPKIDVVMLTHPHYDHFSGIRYYIEDKQMIDKNTLFYINTRYNIIKHNFNNLLSKIHSIQSKIIVPIIGNSNTNINILYPDNIDKSLKLSYNNMSSVYNIRFDNTSYCIFPGDLEKEGWALLNVDKYCKYFADVRLYAISHHGSINGHLREVKSEFPSGCPKRPNKYKLIHEIVSSKAIPVLMGKDGAYKGIYSRKVLNDFKGRILYSEKDGACNPISFLEIDLMKQS